MRSYDVVGPDVYPDLYAKIRPQTDKLLFVNEDTFNPDRTAGFAKHVKHMIEKGQTPDGCGFQSHFSDYAIPSIDDEWKIYESFGAMVKHLTVTEYDFQTLDDQLHADHMRDMLTLCFSHPKMTGFVIWGFWENRHWKPTAAMFRADCEVSGPWSRSGATSSKPSGGRMPISPQAKKVSSRRQAISVGMTSSSSTTAKPRHSRSSTQ